ncbi:hypothetical protein [Azospirillum isscasi]|uniref:Anti-bacteriophage protein A/HamA C-terminal domain-containing protein n=1 Tax=Azospirillum isscasi TaxID=3053926 RepID=A0ABU0WE92_9PROT|nr:hypothetical protein [Azospirillum isscasi]MDQ2102523.1 hypothetical protein [Azospirillum isscasi]
MPLPITLVSDLNTIFSGLAGAGSSYSTLRGQGKQFEFWLTMRFAQRCIAEGHTVEVRRGDDTVIDAANPGVFYVRGGPGAIHGLNPKAPGFIWVKTSSDEYEIHGSLQYIGRSGARHEYDISVLPRSIGDALRTAPGGRAQGGRPYGLPIIGIECKDKANNAPLDEMRACIARLFDNTVLNKGMCCADNQWTSLTYGAAQVRYVDAFKAGFFAVARVGGFQKGAETLASHFHIDTLENMYAPSASDLVALEDGIAKHLP